MRKRGITLRPAARLLFGALGLMATVTLPVLGQLQVTVAGNEIHYTAGGDSGPDKTYCVTAVVVDGTVFAHGTVPPCTTVPLNTGAKACNWAGAHVVSAYAISPTGPNFPLGQPQIVTVTASPPAACNITTSVDFDITNATPSADRRVLLSNMSTNLAGVPNYPYPRLQALLARDKVIPVNLRTIENGAATSGIPVTLRVIDPADPSAYVAGGTGIVQPVPGSQPGDNLGTILPKLKGTGVTDNLNGTYSVTSGANGYIETEMELDASARAGDNYQVVATATFTGGSTKTATSGAITAWKRLFVEKSQMFRAGAPLATNAPAGLPSIVILDEPIASRGVDAFRRNDFVMLMHAPSWGQPKNPVLFYRVVYQVAARPQRFRAQAPAAGPGLVTTNGTAVIVGNGTRFNRLDVGDVINVPTGVPGQREPRVVLAIADNTHLTVDTPPTLVAADQPYTIGDPHLVPGVNYRRVQLDRPLTESYQREPLVRDFRILALNDAVVRLGPGGLTPADYFDADDSQLAGLVMTNAFPAAYAEYIVLPPQPAGGVNPVPRMVLTSAINESGKSTQQFIDKWLALPTPLPLPSTSPDPLDWYRYSTPPNHQLLLIGDTEVRDVTQSGSNGFLSKSIDGERASVLNRGSLEYFVSNSANPLFGADADIVLRRTMVHEITHQWWTDDAVFGHFDHCHPEVAYDSTQPYPTASGTPPPGLRFCLMSWAESGLQMPAPGNPQLMVSMVQYLYRDGYTSFHIAQVPGWHSEYLSIRRTPDPWTP